MGALESSEAPISPQGVSFLASTRALFLYLQDPRGTGEWYWGKRPHIIGDSVPLL